MTDETRFRATKAMAHPQPVPQGTGGRGVRRFEDPLAELARLIGQEDPFADFVATKSAPERRRVSSDGHRPRPQEARHEERDFHAREQRDVHEHDEHEPEHHDSKTGNGAHGYVEAEPEHETSPYKQNGAYKQAAFDDRERNGQGDHHLDPHQEYDLPPVSGRPARQTEPAPRTAQYRYGQKPEQDFAPQPQKARNRFTPPQDEYDYPEHDGYEPQAQRQQRGYGAPQNGHYDQSRNAYGKNGYADAQEAYYDDDRYSGQEAYAEQPRQPQRAPAKGPAKPYDERDPRGKQGRANGKGMDAGYEDDAHLPAHLDDYYSEAPKKKNGKKWILISAAAACILVLGVTGVVGYRAVFGTSGAPKTIKAESTPAKVAPAANMQASEPGKNNDRVGFDPPPGNERMVSRQEEPVGRSAAPGSSPFAPAPSQQAQAPQPRPQAQAPAAEGEPKRVRTVSVRADGSVVGDQRGNTQRQVSNSPMNINSYAERETGSAPAQQAIPSSQRAPVQQSTAPAPASGNPWADIQNSPQRAAPQQQASVQPSGPPPVQRAPAPTIAVQSPMPAGSYVVQVASQKTEQEAQAAWQQVQSRYASVLGGQQAQIRRANLGERGTFYRAQLGPFNDRARASEICENLKAAGGECIIQRN